MAKQEIDLSKHDISVAKIIRNASPARYYEEAIRRDSGSAISSSGALVVRSGKRTGRSPADKRVVNSDNLNEEIWWGNVNIPLDERTFDINRQRATDYLNTKEQLYVIDGFAGWDPNYRLKVRIIAERAYHALFMHNMLIRPAKEELENFGDPDFVVFNAGKFPANRFTEGMTSDASVDVNFKTGEMVILGTEYAGEMKKGIFTVMHYLMPKKNVLSMHCSANEGDSPDDVALFFGLSGTGKTTLSADSNRKLVGDDEHCWSEDGIFNIEGGCYAKTINLSREKEPEIYDAIRFGTVLENVGYDPETRAVDFDDTSITQNTRASYPIDYISNAKIPCTAGHPKNIIFLTYDAFGVLPPVSRLTPEQAMYHFISGYTAKVAGTEVGVTEPEATFSACFGAAFLAWPPSKYAEMLAEKMKKHNASAWLVNTGLTGGTYGTGSRIDLKSTRAIISAIHNCALEGVSTETDNVFGFEVPTQCPGISSDILIPRRTWDDPEAYDRQAQKLGKLFQQNFEHYKEESSEAIAEAGPDVRIRENS
ncbi:phosphoenolpyruvate carboxykinase (ATP) [Aliifodinibius sp. S!AR15-10]|uniref:phosphoenolpyruvate carboxykinase (ATP) n=1 Tax=Aliifodinibius sp. S!AR15-10 TaxID=2950437 RepID=UPI0028596A54|nr:phosphoenolpyruvate carboxykinase (ATP) [Aliifodinibius sp. S!AR15-10]MDR8391298.1 phosphoenolpyruvate carboxykinase (ATP) [Aliifodinibius sp. S!AR15-10]